VDHEVGSGTHCKAPDKDAHPHIPTREDQSACDRDNLGSKSSRVHQRKSNNAERPDNQSSQQAHA
jgi:hypothetical protein